MLRAFKSELQRLRKEEYAMFHAQIRGRVGKRATQKLEEPLVQQILLIPDLMQRIHYYWKQPYVRGDVKGLSSYVFAYLYNTNDILPSDDHGLFGYLDDAYLVGLVYEHVLEEVSRQYLPIAPEDDDLREQVAQNQKSIVKVIPEEAKKMDELFENALSENYDSFAKAVKH